MLVGSRCSGADPNQMPPVTISYCQCYKVAYCSVDCQRKHRPVHKSVCAPSYQPFGTPRLLSLRRSGLTFLNIGEELAMSQGYAGRNASRPMRIR